MRSGKIVVLTGYGSLLPPNVWSGGQDIRQAVRRIPEIGAESLVASAKLRRMDRLAQMAMVAAAAALHSANLSLDGDVALRTGVVFNTWFGPMQTMETYITSIIEHGQKSTPASLYPLTVPNAFTGLVTMELKALGPNLTISGSSAVRFAVDAIRQGFATVMLAGGSDELTPTVVDSFKSCGLIPADEQAVAGEFALAEGAVVLELEEADFAKQRGAVPIAEIVECACGNSVPYTGVPFDLRADHIARTMRRVLERVRRQWSAWTRGSGTRGSCRSVRRCTPRNALSKIRGWGTCWRFREFCGPLRRADRVQTRLHRKRQQQLGTISARQLL
jgi:3-oxoacyl-(acyl-carrier-protein) synthase